MSTRSAASTSRCSEGEIFALLGPNGAGKTTTVEILEGYRDRDAGEVRVLGFDPASGGAAYRDRIGIVLQSAGIELQLTVVRSAAPVRLVLHSLPVTAAS